MFMPDQKTSEEIKEDILKNVVNYYKVKFKSEDKFIPGETRINYAGRIFNEMEMLNLIDSSLEFWLTEGKYCRKFEEEFSRFVGPKYCLLTTSGSSANLLAISSLTSTKLKERRLKQGDEVITVAAGFPTTITPIIQNRAIPVFVDIELETYNIDTSKLDDALSEKTKAVFLAHTLGNPFNIDNVKSFCKENKLWLIEDNCDALGSKYNNVYTGNFGDISTYSFYPAHHITMGEGGAILTNNLALHRIIKSFREWGRDCWCAPGTDNTCKKRFEWQLGTLPYGYDHKFTYSELGYNLKITDMQAAIALAQLQKLPNFIKARKKNHKRLFQGLKKYENSIILPKAQINSDPSWFGFLITLKNNSGLDRRKLMIQLEESKIQTRILFAGNMVRQPAFNEMREDKTGYRVIDELVNTDIVMNNSFWVGVYPGMTKEMIDYMISEISKLFN